MGQGASSSTHATLRYGHDSSKKKEKENVVSPEKKEKRYAFPKKKWRVVEVVAVFFTFIFNVILNIPDFSTLKSGVPWAKSPVVLL